MEEKIKWIFELLRTIDTSDYSYWEELCMIAQKNNFIVSSGASKIGLVFKDWDWVIKLDRPTHNECDREAKLYLKAKELKIEKAFLETRFVGTTELGIKVYIQPKIDITMANLSPYERNKLNEKTSNLLHKIVDKVERGFHTYPPHLWVKLAILAYGKKFMRVLEQFTEDYSINDLHSDNVGLFNNKPVLLDYSGYHGERSGYTID